MLSGGLLIHNLRDFQSFSPQTAKPAQKEFDKAIVASVSIADVSCDFPFAGRLLIVATGD